ncbi:MAG: hypothetical protein HRU35_08275, partial [Rickettsiaceae bacterium]|nr:hypothetical protein [Rickettsiaceae bacterium]
MAKKNKLMKQLLTGASLLTLTAAGVNDAYAVARTLNNNFSIVPNVHISNGGIPDGGAVLKFEINAHTGGTSGNITNIVITKWHSMGGGVNNFTLNSNNNGATLTITNVTQAVDETTAFSVGANNNLVFNAVPAMDFRIAKILSITGRGNVDIRGAADLDIVDMPLGQDDANRLGTLNLMKGNFDFSAQKIYADNIILNSDKTLAIAKQIGGHITATAQGQGVIDFTMTPVAGGSIVLTDNSSIHANIKEVLITPAGTGPNAGDALIFASDVNAQLIKFVNANTPAVFQGSVGSPSFVFDDQDVTVTFSGDNKVIGSNFKDGNAGDNNNGKLVVTGSNVTFNGSIGEITNAKDKINTFTVAAQGSATINSAVHMKGGITITSDNDLAKVGKLTLGNNANIANTTGINSVGGEANAGQLI